LIHKYFKSSFSLVVNEQIDYAEKHYQGDKDKTDTVTTFHRLALDNFRQDILLSSYGRQLFKSSDNSEESSFQE